MELGDLLASLDAVQNETTTVKLTERNTVELVQKLLDRGLFVRAGTGHGGDAAAVDVLDADGAAVHADATTTTTTTTTTTGDGRPGGSDASELMHTSDGKEYLTFEHLVEDVRMSVARMAGRVAVADLPGLTRVDVAHCQRAADRLVATDADMQMLQEELISRAYFDELAREVAETLRDTGAVSLAELAQRFSLSADVLRSQLGTRSDALDGARLEAGLLSSAAHTARLRSAVRGAMRGCTRPAVVSTLASRTVREEGGYTASNVAAAAESVTSSGEVDGELKGPNFTPAVCRREAEDRVARFLHDNGIVATAEVRSVCGKKKSPTKWCEAKSPGGHMLDSHYITAATLTLMEVAVDEAIASETWVDCATVLPTDCTSLDVEAALHASEAVARLLASGRVTVAAGCVISDDMMAVFLRRMKQLATDEAVHGVEKLTAAKPQPAAYVASSAAAKGATPTPAASSGNESRVDKDNEEEEEDGGGNDDGADGEDEGIASRVESHSTGKAGSTKQKQVASGGRSQRKKGGISLTLSDDDDDDDWDTSAKGKGKKGKKGRRSGGVSTTSTTTKPKEEEIALKKSKTKEETPSVPKRTKKGKKGKTNSGGAAGDDSSDKVHPPTNEAFMRALAELDENLESVTGGDDADDDESLLAVLVESLRPKALEIFESALDTAMRDARLKATAATSAASAAEASQPPPPTSDDPVAPDAPIDTTTSS